MHAGSSSFFVCVLSLLKQKNIVIASDGAQLSRSLGSAQPASQSDPHLYWLFVIVPICLNNIEVIRSSVYHRGGNFVIVS